MKTFSKKLDALLGNIGAYGKTLQHILGAAEIAKTPTVWAIGAAHIVAIFGIAILGWDIFSVIILFWSETVIVYLATIIKMVVSAAYHYRRGEPTLYNALAIVIFYGLSYTAVSWVILMSIAPPQTHTSFPIAVAPAFLSFNSFGAAFSQSAIGIFAFAISHIISFFVNFIRRKEYESGDFSAMAKIPHQRFGYGLLTILIGASAAYAMRSPIPFIPVIIVKILLDFVAHSKEHRLF